MKRFHMHDVTAAILVSQNNETAAMLVFQTNCVSGTFFFYKNLLQFQYICLARWHAWVKTLNWLSCSQSDYSAKYIDQQVAESLLSLWVHLWYTERPVTHSPA